MAQTRTQILLLALLLVVVALVGEVYAAPAPDDAEGSAASPGGESADGPGGESAGGPGGASADGPGGDAAGGPGGAEASGACQDNVVNVPVVAGVTAAVVAGYVF